MNVVITCTPEFSYDKLNEIVSLLNNIPGELKFIKGQPWTQAQFNRLRLKIENINQIASLTFDEYFDVVQDYRVLKDINDDCFVIVVSSIKNDQDWFSAFKKKNIFIHGDEWDLISNVDSKFGIAHQCVENIFQSISELDIDDYESEPNIHQKSLGCINDFCDERSEILIKLQSATICPSCYQRAMDNGMTNYIMVHIINIIEEIRKEFVISRNYLCQNPIDKVVVDEKGNITIGNRIIKMEILPKVMYITFLNQIEGIPTNKLCESKTHFDEIYQILKLNPDDYAITRMCCNKIQYKDKIEKNNPTFETYRSKIKIALKEKLGDVLSNFYTINLTTVPNMPNIFKVPLSLDHFEIHPKFSK